ncbi:MAG: neutral/alkaline non-lysosomal ceramidase N-terminal domain-containing protein [Deltaproteobacteria bacterium]|nr:neutral/alkaline non-lysosomal ceramidase N-terminal domain-containing protein [Deltaproteobacteria bacterium]
MLRPLSLLLPLALFACGEDPDPVATGPGALQVGVATARMPIPLGISTVGFGPSAYSEGPSPYADFYHATQRIHGHPEFKAVVLSRGEGHEVVLLRGDLIGVFQQIRTELVLELEGRLGRDLDDALILGGTHTHSGPGRIVQGGGLFNMIADVFLPEHYDRMVDSMADVVEAAYADLAPGRVGWTTAFCAEAHADRRCEDGLDYTNDTVSLLAVEREGELAAVVMSYAVHGTILGRDDLTLSSDSAGGIEQYVEDGFDHPVEVLFFNSWGADMSPSSPPITGVGAPQRPGYDRMEALGAAVAASVHQTLREDPIAWEEEPVLASETLRVPINREVLGYDADTFPYPYGGMYCTGSPEDCDTSTVVEDLDKACLPFNEDYPAPMQTLFTAGQIGGTHFITFPGEAVTLLAEEIVGQLQQREGVESVAFFGYAQDFTGYSVLIDDYWQGGYEAGAGLWGPMQGEYYVTKAVAAMDKYLDPAPMSVVEDLGEPLPLPPFQAGDYTPYQPDTALDVGVIDQDVHPTYAPTEVVELAVRGSDPWLGTPIAWLEHADGTPVLRPNGVPVNSDDLAFWTDLSVSPSWGDTLDPTPRAYSWRFHMPASHAVPMLDLDGDYRLRVELPVEGGGIEAVTSAVFAVHPQG